MSDVKRYVHVGTADRLVSVNETNEWVGTTFEPGIDSRWVYELDYASMQARAEAAEAEKDQLREALQRIASGEGNSAFIAEAALASLPQPAEGCPNCHGSGLVEATSPEALARGDEQELCADCRGTGCAASEKEGGK